MKNIKPIEAFDPEDPLKPVAKEPATASEALRDYALMGSKRSLKALQDRYQNAAKVPPESGKKKTRRPPTVRLETLKDYSVKYRWQDRVKVYDEIIMRKELEMFEAERKKWREFRLKAAKNLLSQAVKALNSIDPSNANLTQISRIIAIAMQELRIEFGEEKQMSIATDVTIRVVRENKKPILDDLQWQTGAK